MSDLLSIGASGTRAYQAAMGAIADNISNAETPGYSRRTVALGESAASSAPLIFYRSNSSFHGVETKSVVRASDTYLDAAARQTANGRGMAEQHTRWMNDIQTALNDTSLGVGQRMSGMFASVERLASNPTDTTLRSDVLFAFEQVNTAFQQSRGDLTTIRTAIGSGVKNDVVALNDAMQQLANANDGLRRVAEGTAAHASLLDSRDLALHEVVSRLDVTVTFGANGAASVDYGGQTLVEHNSAKTITVTQAADGILTFGVAGGSVMPTPQGGSLGGFAASAVVVKDRIDALDTLATRYVQEINDWHTQGFSTPGVAGTPMLTMGANAGEISVAVTNPALVAGYSSTGVLNGNFLKISALRGNDSIENDWTGVIAEHGSVTNAAKLQLTAATNRDLMAQQARAEVVGVNLDREAADLMRLQQAYQASARVIQVSRELMNSIFAIF